MIRLLILGAIVLTCMAAMQTPPPRVAPAAAPGVPLSLAEERARRISNLRYELHFSIPADAAARIRGRAVLRFTLADASRPLVLDFSPPGPQRGQASGRDIQFTAVPDHLVVGPEDLREGPNEIAIDFDAGDGSLNRNPEFMYTLVRPGARAARVSLLRPARSESEIQPHPRHSEGLGSARERARNRPGRTAAIG